MNSGAKLQAIKLDLTQMTSCRKVIISIEQRDSAVFFFRSSFFMRFNFFCFVFFFLVQLTILASRSNILEKRFCFLRLFPRSLTGNLFYFLISTAT